MCVCVVVKLALVAYLYGIKQHSTIVICNVNSFPIAISSHYLSFSQVELQLTPASSKWLQSWLLLCVQSSRRVSVPVQNTSSRRMGRSVTMPYRAFGWAMASASWRESRGRLRAVCTLHCLFSTIMSTQRPGYIYK